MDLGIAVCVAEFRDVRAAHLSDQPIKGLLRQSEHNDVVFRVCPARKLLGVGANFPVLFFCSKESTVDLHCPSRRSVVQFSVTRHTVRSPHNCLARGPRLHLFNQRRTLCFCKCPADFVCSSVNSVSPRRIHSDDIQYSAHALC